MEWENRTWLFFEFKRGGAPVPTGQKLALERTARLIEERGKTAWIFIVRHFEEDPENDIKAAGAIVSEYYYRGRWLKPKARHTLKECVDIAWKQHEERGV